MVCPRDIKMSAGQNGVFGTLSAGQIFSENSSVRVTFFCPPDKQ